MSHFVDVKTTISSTEDIRACLTDLGYTIVETKTVRGYGGTTVHVEFAVKLNKVDTRLAYVKGPMVTTKSPRTGGEWKV